MYVCLDILFVFQFYRMFWIYFKSVQGQRYFEFFQNIFFINEILKTKIFLVVNKKKKTVFMEIKIYLQIEEKLLKFYYNWTSIKFFSSNYRFIIFVVLHFLPF